MADDTGGRQILKPALFDILKKKYASIKLLYTGNSRNSYCVIGKEEQLS